MTKEMKRPISNITQDSIKPLLSNAVEFYTNKNREAHKRIQERDEYINYLESKLSNAKPQQALPVVPEDVDKAIKYLKKHNNSTWSDLGDILTEKGFSWLNDFQFKDRRFGFGGLNNKLFILSHLAITGYQVEKQLFYIDLPKVFGLSDSTSDSTFVSKAESGIILEFTKGKDYALKLTEQEIKSIDERYWQFAVPVEDGE
ncbi:DUF1642 domain-containing protein [Lactococcus lactis]|uniref:DUF1642 domain-containing protein n=1 Tax=Lactococcus lactis TaxID=1358 RepID=UPI0025A29BA8|nr:DUF1642 domain-containing protein [Lactococcus lactis]MDM7650987.1 DUF1642 domain-containing protein [Lactococcus lactis]